MGNSNMVKSALKFKNTVNSAFWPYVIESFGFSHCVRRTSKPRYKAQIYCSILYGFIVMGFSNTVKYSDFDVYGHIWSIHEILTVHHRAKILCSIPRFWGSTDKLAKTKMFYYVRFKSYGQNAELAVFLNFKANFAIFELPIKI